MSNKILKKLYIFISHILACTGVQGFRNFKEIMFFYIMPVVFTEFPFFFGVDKKWHVNPSYAINLL